MTAAEAAALIKNGDHIAMSGFTPAGVAKATTKELAKYAIAEHEAGREFKVAIFTGASTGQSTDGDLANAQAILYRAPYTTNPDFRKHVNMGGTGTALWLLWSFGLGYPRSVRHRGSGQ